MRDEICVLSGGTGTPKLLQGLVELLPPRELKIVVNTADDVIVDDLYVSPDVDAVIYTLAGIIDQEKWYGITGDTYRIHEGRVRKGHRDLLRIGDTDRANSARRTELLESGKTLSEAILDLRIRLGVEQEIWPMTDSRVASRIVTPHGVKDFQEYWVRDGGRDDVVGVEFRGIEKAAVSDGAKKAILSASAALIGPSNPVTSIGPILETGGVREILEGVRVVAVSPLKGGSPFSGPAGRMLRGLGYAVSPVSIAEIYGGFLDCLLIDESDSELAEDIERLGVQVRLTQIEMQTSEDKFKLARAALAACREGE